MKIIDWFNSLFTVSTYESKPITVLCSGENSFEFANKILNNLSNAIVTEYVNTISEINSVENFTLIVLGKNYSKKLIETTKNRIESGGCNYTLFISLDKTIIEDDGFSIYYCEKNDDMEISRLRNILEKTYKFYGFKDYNNWLFESISISLLYLVIAVVLDYLLFYSIISRKFYIMNVYFNMKMLSTILYFVIWGGFVLLCEIITVYTFKSITSIIVGYKKYRDDVKEFSKKIPLKFDIHEVDGKKELKEYVDITSYMTNNVSSINEFYDWTKKNARQSFWFAVILFIVGIALLGFPVIFTYLTNKNLDTLGTIVPLVGGAITELLSATALIVYRKSLEQLNYYHKSLHDDQRFLTSINILSEFKDQKDREEMLKKIIMTEMNIKEESQNNEIVESDESASQETSD